MVPDSHPSSPITVSVVSHGHDAWLPPLLDDLARAPAGLLHRVVVTHNLPAAPLHVEGLPFELLQIHNPSPLGFGANHNQAFAHADTPFFAVLNPDMRLRDPALWPQMLSAARQPGIGAVTATLLNPDGSVQDNQRALVTPWSLFRRRVLRQPEQRVDWFSASFLLMPAAVYRAVAGFDERYHMYCEDVDLCLRLQLAGLRLERSAATAEHHAQRDSLRRWRPLWWHVHSLLRLWCSVAFWRYQMQQLSGRGRR
jgi:N-acetylglucosaminyl-diphospho-decaprenol L-rhamnosyltransferase